MALRFARQPKRNACAPAFMSAPTAAGNSPEWKSASDPDQAAPGFVIASQRVGAKRRPMTGSAKQSGSREKGLDCFVASAPRNDGRTLLLMTAEGHRGVAEQLAASIR
jgi:hypothetical protein